MNLFYVILGVPKIEFEGVEKKNDTRFCFKVTIKSIPAPCDAQWSIKENNESMFRIIDNNAEEYKGTSNAFPHSVLVVNKKNLEKYSFQIKVENFIGSKEMIIPGKTSFLLHSKIDIQILVDVFPVSQLIYWKSKTGC